MAEARCELKTKIIANPRSAGGRTGKNWPEIERVLAGRLSDFHTEFTSAPGSATQIARRALHDGFEMIACAGGDGTINETVNGFFDSGAVINPNARFGVLTAGTGCDFIKTAGIPRDISQCADILASGEPRAFDAGRLRYTAHDGSTAEMYFINIADFGLGGETVNLVNSSSKILPGKLTFLLGITRAALAYRNKPVTLTADGGEPFSRKIKNVIVANGRFFAGGMQIAKDADPSDGLFDLLVIGDLGFIEGTLLMPRMYRGDITGHPKVEHMRVRTLRADSETRVLLDIDGEQPGMLPAEFEIIPGAVKVMLPAARPDEQS